jgi:hypothetical protein
LGLQTKYSCITSGHMKKADRHVEMRSVGR